jgi:K+-transporting ATPase ATPase B chain
LQQFSKACALSSVADETPEGKSILELAKIPVGSLDTRQAVFIRFTAETRSSGIELPGNIQIRKGAADAIKKMVLQAGNIISC